MEDSEKKLRKKKIILVSLTVAILFLPLLLTCEPISILSFKETGPIGDTIGGIMSPFIAILVGYLTFEAFRMQYEANELHRKDKVNDKLNEIRERFDNRFYTMLETLRTNSLGVKCGNNVSGKDAFKTLVAELFVTYYVVKGAYLKYKPTASEEIRAFLTTLDDEVVEMMLTRMAYGLFFYGNLYYVDKEAEPQFFEILENVNKGLKRNGNGTRHEYEYSLNHELRGELQALYLPWDLFQGHNDQLGHYFRHLYQMVKFLALADSKVISEQDKNEYARIIRAELSDFEQALLFYNAVSDRGVSWLSAIGEESDNEYSKRGLLSRFRLIKNIPGNILYRGIDPWTYFNDDIQWWKIHGKNFFEQSYIITADDEYGMNQGTLI